MIPLEEIERARIPGQEDDIVLLRRGEEYSIRTAGKELMNSRLHASEDLLAKLACSRLERKSGRRILVGGLGMGYTLAAALKESEPDTHITVAELIPAVVGWNRSYLGHLAGTPLDDPRVSIAEEDVAETIGRNPCAWDAILLDVDNGPNGLTRKTNDRLYTLGGLQSALSALRPKGILAVWSSGADASFTRRLKQCGFRTQTVAARAHKPAKGARHTIWLAVKP
jgi:spermidine synthase